MNLKRRKYTVRTTVTAVRNIPIIPPTVTYANRYWMKFTANSFAKFIPSYMPPGYKSKSEVVLITDEINKEIP